jgi:SAM-dependent methyltransferase
MLHFITKAEVFAALDAGLQGQLNWPLTDVHLKTWQDLVLFAAIKDSAGLDMAEIGGGNSRLLHALKDANRCCNVDRFDGSDGGPAAEVMIPGVRNVLAYLGDFSPTLPDSSLDVIYSVSVLEHVPDAGLAAVLDDSLRILRPGGRAFHAIDLYVGSDPFPWSQARLDRYCAWMDDPRLEPLGPVTGTAALFHSRMASNPDLTMWHWSRSGPAMRPLREDKQSVSLMLAFRKR